MSVVELLPQPVTVVEVGGVEAQVIEFADVGVQGPPGVGANTTTPVVAGQAIGALKAVTIGSDNLAWLADPATAAVAVPVAISVQAGAAGETIGLRSTGLVTDEAWNWSPGTIWLGPNGTLTQVPPTTGAIVSMGVAAGPDRMRVDPKLVGVI